MRLSVNRICVGVAISDFVSPQPLEAKREHHSLFVRSTDRVSVSLSALSTDLPFTVRLVFVGLQARLNRVGAAALTGAAISNPTAISLLNFMLTPVVLAQIALQCLHCASLNMLVERWLCRNTALPIAGASGIFTA